MNAGQKRAEKKKRELTLQRENRLEEQEQLIRELKARIQELEAQNRNLSESFNTISNSTCWKITKPVRVVMDAVKSMLSPHCRKGLYSLRTNDVPGTSQKTVHEFRRRGDPAQPDRQRLFSEPELKAQREHAFPQAIRFSVVVPLYNTPKRFLRSMIECVLAQTYADWELCMADGSDGEHSDVEQICLEYAEKDRRIRYRKLEKNLGISGNTNACLEMAQGDYIGLFDHDDLLHPAALYEVMRAIEKTGADFIYTDEAVFESPNIKKITNIHFKPDFAPDNLRANNYICHFTVFKRALLDEVGLFDPACDGSQNHDMVLRLTEKAQRIAHIPEILYYRRADKDSAAGGTETKTCVIQAGVRAVEKQLERLGLEGKVEPVLPGMPIYRSRYVIRGTPKVSVLIPNYEHINDLKTCLNSIFNKTTWPN